MAADLHTHTEASADSSLSVDERTEMAREAGIDTVAITDHRTVHEWFDDRQATHRGVRLVAGVEINPCIAEYGDIHILGHFVDPRAMREAIEDLDREVARERSYEDAIDAIHAAGGAAVVAHPGRYDVDLEAAVAHLAELGVDGIEVSYPYDEYGALPEAVPHTSVDRIDDLADEHGLVRTGGSDCHGGEREHMGLVRAPDEWVGELRAAAEQYR